MARRAVIRAWQGTHSSLSEERQYSRIDDRKQLFLDDRIVEEICNVRRVQHHPVKHPGNPLVGQDRPWEKNVYFRTSNYSVAYVPEEKRFKCWYEDLDLGVEGKTGSCDGNSVLYAESADGLEWEKPELDRVRFEGRRTNIVLQGCEPFGAMPHSATVLYDPVDADPAQRYKMMFNGCRTGANLPKKNEQRIGDSCGLGLAFSPDGINWAPYPDNPVVPNWGSDVEVLSYDPIAKKYVIMGRADAPWYSPHPDYRDAFGPVRPNDPRGASYPRRLVYRLESDDCIHWSEPVLVSAPDKTDNLDDQHYSLTHWRVDDYHLGMLTVFHGVPDTVTLQLAWSYDGIHWNRTQDRPDLIPLGPGGSYDCFMAECPTLPITVGDKHWLFYGGSKVHHDWWSPTAQRKEKDLAENLAFGTHLCLATIGIDRWVSLHAFQREGYVQTFPVFSTGSKLIINGRCEKGGYIGAEISDNWSNVWDGFGRSECDVFSGDAVRHVVSWKGRTDVNMIPGIVKVKFYLKNAHLFSFRIADE